VLRNRDAVCALLHAPIDVWCWIVERAGVDFDIRRGLRLDHSDLLHFSLHLLRSHPYLQLEEDQGRPCQLHRRAAGSCIDTSACPDAGLRAAREFGSLGLL